MYDSKKVKGGLTQSGREQGIRRLTAINLMKRMESSVYAFRLTLTRIRDYIDSTIGVINDFENNNVSKSMMLKDYSDVDESEFDSDDINDDVFAIGKKVKIDLADMDYKTWKHELAKDKEVLDFRDSSMASDSVATNFEQIFATYSPETVRKVL